MNIQERALFAPEDLNPAPVETMPSSTDPALLILDTSIRPRMWEETKFANLFTAFEAGVANEGRWPSKRWNASDAVVCPRMVWYRRHGVKLPTDVAAWGKMKYGTLIEGLEEQLLDMSLAALNTRTISSILPKYPRLKQAVEGALRAQSVGKGGKVWRRFLESQIRDHYVLQLPFHLAVDGLNLPISCVADAVLLIHDRPVGLEIKSSYSWGIKGLKEAAAKSGAEKGLRPQWLAQVALYSMGLGIPFKIHAWGREDLYHTELDVDWNENGEFCVNGYVQRIGDTNPAEFAVRRFLWLQTVIDAPAPPGEITELDYGVFRLVLGDDFPTFDGEFFQLVLDSNGEVVMKTTKSSKHKPSWCHTCEARHLCYPWLPAPVGPGLEVEGE